MTLSYHLRRVLDLDSLLARFEHVSGGGTNSQGIRQFHAWCPAHETHHQSLEIGVATDGRYLVHCHSGCSAEQIMGAVGLSVADLYPDGAMANKIAPIQKPFEAMVDQAHLDIARTSRGNGQRPSSAERRAERDAWIRTKQDTSWPKGGGS